MFMSPIVHAISYSVNFPQLLCSVVQLQENNFAYLSVVYMHMYMYMCSHGIYMCYAAAVWMQLCLCRHGFTGRSYSASLWVRGEAQ